MSERRYVSPFGPPPSKPQAPAPDPSWRPPQPPPNPIVSDKVPVFTPEHLVKDMLTYPTILPPQQPFDATLSFSEQIGQGLKPYIDKMTINGVARAIGVTSNTVGRLVSGLGMKVSTMELAARMCGWTVTVTDRNGRTVALFEPTKKRS